MWVDSPSGRGMAFQDALSGVRVMFRGAPMKRDTSKLASSRNSHIARQALIGSSQPAFGKTEVMRRNPGTSYSLIGEMMGYQTMLASWNHVMGAAFTQLKVIREMLANEPAMK